MADRDIKNLEPDLDAQFNEAFNSMIGDVLADLATEANSPVWTGFLASSWRAQKSQVRQKDRVEDFQPWSSIKNDQLAQLLPQIIKSDDEHIPMLIKIFAESDPAIKSMIKNRENMINHCKEFEGACVANFRHPRVRRVRK